MTVVSFLPKMFIWFFGAPVSNVTLYNILYLIAYYFLGFLILVLESCNGSFPMHIFLLLPKNQTLSSLSQNGVCILGLLSLFLCFMLCYASGS